MTKEKLFELAVSLAAANISAGQFNNGMNFGTIVFDDVQTAFDRLEAVWKQVSGEPAEPVLDEPVGGGVTH